MATETSRKNPGLNTKSNNVNSFDETQARDLEKLQGFVEEHGIDIDELRRITKLLQKHNAAPLENTEAAILQLGGHYAPPLEDTDPRRPASSANSSSGNGRWDALYDLVIDSAFHQTVHDWASSSYIYDQARIDSTAMTVAKLIARIESRDHITHLLQGAVQLGKTSMCILAAMILASRSDIPVIIAYLSDSQTGNHKQNLQDWKTVSDRSVMHFNVPSSMDNDHAPAQNDYNKRIENRVRNLLTGQSPPELIVMSTKKNSDNISPFNDVINELQGSIPGRFKLYVVNDEADAQTVLSSLEKPNEAYVELEKMAEMADGVIHVTATPQAVLAIPYNHILAPCSVTVMSRPSSYVSPHSLWLNPQKLEEHVLSWIVDGIPFQQRRIEEDLAILETHDASVRKKLSQFLVCQGTKAYLMQKDSAVEQPDCAALLQLTRFKAVQNRIVEMLGRIKRLSNIKTKTQKEDFMGVLGYINACDIRAHNGTDPSPLRSSGTPEDPINAIYVALDMLSRARRVVGLVTVAVWHMGNRPSVDLYRQRDRMSGHEPEGRKKFITWHLPKPIIETLYGIAIAQEKQRNWLEMADQEDLEIRNRSIPLFYALGGVSTSRQCTLKPLESSSLFTSGKFDRKFWPEIPTESIISELNLLIAKAAEMGLQSRIHRKGRGNRLQILGTGGELSALLSSTIARNEIGIAPESSLQLLERFESVTSVNTSLSEIPSVLTVQLAGKEGPKVQVNGMANCRITNKSRGSKPGEISGSITGGTGSSTVKDWDLDWRKDKSTIEDQRWGFKRSPLMGSHFLLTALRLPEDDESVARFAIGAEIPLGLWSDHENAMLRPGGIV